MGESNEKRIKWDLCHQLICTVQMYAGKPLSTEKNPYVAEKKGKGVKVKA